MTSSFKHDSRSMPGPVVSENKRDAHFTSRPDRERRPLSRETTPSGAQAAISKGSPIRIEQTTHVQNSYSSMLDHTESNFTDEMQTRVVPQTLGKRNVVHLRSIAKAKTTSEPSSPQQHADFDRGSPVNREAKLFNPKKDAVPMIRARQSLPVKYDNKARAEKVTSRAANHGAPIVRHKHRTSGSDQPAKEGLQGVTFPSRESSRCPLSAEVLSHAHSSCSTPKYGELRLLRRSSEVSSELMCRPVSIDGELESKYIDIPRIQLKVKTVEAALRSSIALILRGSEDVKQPCSFLPRKITSAHHELLDLYVELLDASRRSTASHVALQVNAKALTSSMWSSAALLVYDLLDSIEPILSPTGVDIIAELQYTSLLHAYTVYAHLMTTFVHMHKDWASFLARLSVSLSKATRRDNVISASHWEIVATDWNRISALTSSSESILS